MGKFSVQQLREGLARRQVTRNIMAAKKDESLKFKISCKRNAKNNR